MKPRRERYKSYYIHLRLVDGEVLCEVVLDGRDDSLHELEEHYEVRVHSHLSSTLCDSLYYFLHYFRVPGIKEFCIYYLYYVYRLDVLNSV